MSDDNRLERLYDYTKWHIGLYLTLGGGLVAGIGYMYRDGQPFHHILKGPFLLFSFIAMVFAGIAGGVIGSSLAYTKKWEEFWEMKQGFWGIEPLTGKDWTHVEHICFWLSLSLATTGVLRGEIANITRELPKTECTSITDGTKQFNLVRQ